MSGQQIGESFHMTEENPSNLETVNNNCDIPASELIWTYAYDYNYLVSGAFALVFFILVSLCFKKGWLKYIIIGIIAILLGLILYRIINRKAMNTIAYSCY